jgi:hypothetical protein
LFHSSLDMEVEFNSALVCFSEESILHSPCVLGHRFRDVDSQLISSFIGRLAREVVLLGAEGMDDGPLARPRVASSTAI